MLRLQLMQNWFGHRDSAMEDALYEIAPLCELARLSLTGAIPDETTLLNVRHLLERHDLAVGTLAAVNSHLVERGLLLRQDTIMDATIIHMAPRPKIGTVRATRRCIRRRSATGSTSE